LNQHTGHGRKLLKFSKISSSSSYYF